MVLRDLFLFLIIQVAMVCLSYVEAYSEGSQGWKWNPKWWRIPLPGGYWYHSYHVFLFLLMLPLLIFGIPFALIGWDSHIMLVLFFSYLMGAGLEDFLWFVVNPEYPFNKWNPRDTRWYPWITVGKFSLPLSYVIKILAGVVLFYFIYQDWKMVL